VKVGVVRYTVAQAAIGSAWKPRCPSAPLIWWLLSTQLPTGLPLKAWCKHARTAYSGVTSTGAWVSNPNTGLYS